MERVGIRTHGGRPSIEGSHIDFNIIITSFNLIRIKELDMEGVPHPQKSEDCIKPDSATAPTALVGNAPTPSRPKRDVLLLNHRAMRGNWKGG